MKYEDFFRKAYGKENDPDFGPYNYQRRLAEEPWPDLLDVPTGMGKTAAVVLAWLWKRHVLKDSATPRRLVYCLPMRVLVEQTVANIEGWLKAHDLYGKPGEEKVSVNVLMGGEEDVHKAEWASYPEEGAILVGTQDMLLSRALNRGYGMHRFEWPVHFGLLNQDCFWVMDEIQLMGPGLLASVQLDWMRQVRFTSLQPCRSLWMSATIGTEFLATKDRKNDGMDKFMLLDTQLENDQSAEVRLRRLAIRQVAWFNAAGDSNSALAEEIAQDVEAKHVLGTLSLIVCNTVDMARNVFQALNSEYKILLTSRFRHQDRERHEKNLFEFEAMRQQYQGNPVPDDPGLICVSTQVVEAGLDISAHWLWSELSPWPSVIQRLGRLNRDGRDQEARAWFWETPNEGRGKQEWIGPYEASDITRAKKLLNALSPLSKSKTFSQALEAVQDHEKKEFKAALQPKPTPLPRALDVHSLFSTERDVHGGFTDVSAFVRGTDPDADLTVFWREWQGNRPPHGDDLDGPDINVRTETCSVAFFRLRDMLKTRHAPAWIWSDEDEQWERAPADDLRPGMVVMLHRDVGGYRADVGWTGKNNDVLDGVPPAGRGRALRDDARTEIGFWATLDVHLNDARREAEQLCDAVALNGTLRTAVVEGAALHDLGKAHPQWQQALPAGAPLAGGPWAKCPRVVAVDAVSNNQEIRDAFLKLRPRALALANEQRKRGREEVVRLRWAVAEKLKRDELEGLKKLKSVRWAGHVPFRPGLRHEAASALAMWKHYRNGNAPYPALAVYLAASHHGKVRTVLRTTTDDGNDVFGVPRNPDTLDFLSMQWPLDFSVAKDGAEGQWENGDFILTAHGWTGLVADLLGPWRADDATGVGVVPPDEPRRLGPFALAYLEALVRIADWRASDKPSKSIKPEEVPRND